ncbi:cytochrome b5 domain-containing protein [Clostridium sp. BL-8]|uniref:cytochrome b5 domain-containing protein n=1 Tax=Clostridium sp. BL-8 TaxID=349938 RepID=UPI00098CD9DF|nr:cytochrome b5 domain-containing protein [Clostridium sp. BL-8]OOM69229.1 cytochrome b5-like heme/steroid binding domain protein [Clostridium sp. BL-8]
MTFKFKPINELIDNIYCNRQKRFTLEELAQYDGSDGKPTYVAVDGIVYDLSNVSSWSGGSHFGAKAGKDLTDEFNSHHGMKEILSNIPKVGVLSESKKKGIVSITRQPLVDTYDFSPDDWIQYITPLVDDALEEADGGVRLEHLFQKYIMIGILVGEGRTFQEAIDEIGEWENTGVSKLLDESRGNI